MTFEFRDDLNLERAHARRWVSIIAVVIPVAAFVLLVSWFIRAYVAPPTVTVPNPMVTATATPPLPPSIPVRTQVEAPKPQLAQIAAQPTVSPQAEVPAAVEPPRPVATAEPAGPPPVPERKLERIDPRAEITGAMPMLATLEAAPPSLESAPPAYVEPAPVTQAQSAPVPSPAEAAPATATADNKPHELSEPIAGPIPVPRKKPHITVALLTGHIPLPRPKPTDALPPPDLPEFDRHAVQ
jgi:hypothetical protein